MTRTSKQERQRTAQAPAGIRIPGEIAGGVLLVLSQVLLLLVLSVLQLARYLDCLRPPRSVPPAVLRRAARMPLK